MPQIFDNIELHLLPSLQKAIKEAYKADFCVGYFNLRGWKEIAGYIDDWEGCEGHCIRLLIGMQRPPEDELRALYSLSENPEQISNSDIVRLKKKLAQAFKDQLTIGTPTNDDEAALRRLSKHIKEKKVIVKLYLAQPLHAKLYLLYRKDEFTPILPYLGSSNLTLAGLSHQGELNVDVMDQSAAQKLSLWFENRWSEYGCVDISEELAKIIDESWARETIIPPYHIYVKMAYHLSQEARSGLTEFKIPKDFGNKLLPFQVAAVKIAAHHLHRRGGVLIGDVVGLGKTLMATALARIFEDDFGWETLIICPRNLVPMWEKYKEQYRMRARVLSISRVIKEFSGEFSRYRIVIMDESHNLRNRDGHRYKAVHDYLEKNESKVILLSATPYNKTYLDLSNQLRLFVPEDKTINIRPEKLIREMGETQFIAKYQCAPRSLAAFEKSEYADDWRELMRLYTVRRTRSFIMQNYAQTDEADGRKFLSLDDGTKTYFPKRIPKTIRFTIDENDPTDQYARLYTPDVVDTINSLNLPRYGLGTYVNANEPPDNSRDTETIKNLGKAGKRLMGFCRTNLFKRLESSGYVFLQSIERHILRNFIYLHAIENNQPLPIGTQEAQLLDSRYNDDDTDNINFFDIPDEDEHPEEMIDEEDPIPEPAQLKTLDEYREQANRIYQVYRTKKKQKFKWIASKYFAEKLQSDLLSDSIKLLKIIEKYSGWDWKKDTKLNALYEVVQKEHKNDKVLVFTQFADTVHYLKNCLTAMNIQKLEGVAGSDDDPTSYANRFSPQSNETKSVQPEKEIRVLIATDVLSEGQNLQDGWIVVNYDLPWAIVRLIQRAGRVDRIGQKSQQILCFSFLPAEGVEQIIKLRKKVRTRLKQNAEVLGTDESFFEDEMDENRILDLYNEKSGILDGEDDTEVDLTSYAYQIWKNAITNQPGLKKIIEEMPPMVFSAKALPQQYNSDPGVLVYVRTGEDNDALAWVNQTGESVTESQYEILKAAECKPDELGLHHADIHHELVKAGVSQILKQEKPMGGALGSAKGIRFRVYERLQQFVSMNKGTLFVTQELSKAIDDIYRYPLKETAKDTLNNQFRSKITDDALAELVVNLREENRLCVIEDEYIERPPRLICSMGLQNKT